MQREQLPIWTTVHVALLIMVGHVLGARQTALTAYSLTFIFYWLSCWILILCFQPTSTASHPRPKQHPIFDWLPFLPLPGLLYVVVSTNLTLPTVSYVITITCLAVINGFTEEMYWRRLYMEAFPSNLASGFIIPWILFTLWHVALLRIPNIVYRGGALGLLGGALILGFLWGLSYWKNRRYWVIGLAHTAVNVIAFTMLAIENAWLPG